MSRYRTRAADGAARAAAGFTLVEILVVVVIIGIVAAGAVLSFSSIGQDRELDNETDRLVALMNYAREQSELQTRELGLYCGEHTYKFLAYNPLTNLWDDIKDDDSLRLRQLPDGLRLQLSVEARDVVLAKPTDTSTSKLAHPEDLQPHVMIFSNGDLTSFALTLVRDDTARSATIAPDDQGRVKRLPQDAKT